MMKKLLTILLTLFVLVGCGAATKSQEAIMDNEIVTSSEISLEETNYDYGEKVIVNGNMSISSTDIKTVVEKINTLMKEYGAYTISKSESNYNDFTNVSVSIRIPSDKFNVFVEEIKEGNNVTDLYVNSSDITDVYRDNEARLNNLKAEEKRLLELMDKAETVSDVVLVEGELTDVRSQIEYLETILKNYDTQVAYSTLDIYISSERTTTSYSFINRIKDAFANMLSNFVEVVKDFVVFIIYAIPYLILVVIIVLTIRYIKKKKIKKTIEK